MYAKYVKLIKEPKACDSAGRVIPSILGVTTKERDKMHTQYLINAISNEEDYCIASQMYGELCYHNNNISMLSSKTNDTVCLTYLKSKPMLVTMISDVVSKVPSALKINEDKLTDILLLLTHTQRSTLVQALMKIKSCIGLVCTEEEGYQLAAEILKRSTGYSTTEYDDGVVISGNYMYPVEITIKLKYATKVYITPEPLEYGDSYKGFTSKNKAKISDEDEYYLYCASEQKHIVDPAIINLPIHIPTHDKEGIPLTLIQQRIIAAQTAQLKAFAKFHKEGYLTFHRDSTGRYHHGGANKTYRFGLKSDHTCHIPQQEQMLLNILLS